MTKDLIIALIIPPLAWLGIAPFLFDYFYPFAGKADHPTRLFFAFVFFGPIIVTIRLYKASIHLFKLAAALVREEIQKKEYK